MSYPRAPIRPFVASAPPCIPILAFHSLLRRAQPGSHADLLRSHLRQSGDLLRLSILSTHDDPLNGLLNPLAHPAPHLFTHTSSTCIPDLLRNPIPVPV